MEDLILENQIDEILFELNFSQLKHNMISRSILRIDKPNTILLTLPDNNTNILDIYKSGIFLFNSDNIIVPNKLIRILNKTFNGKEYALDIRKQLLNVTSGRKFKIAHSINTIAKNIKDENKPNKSFHIYDLSLYSKALSHFEKTRGIRFATRRVFNEISKIYKSIKTKLPTISIELLFLVKNQQGFVYNLFNDARNILPKQYLDELSLFDNFALVSNLDKTIIPVMYKEKGFTKFSWPNISRLSSLIEDQETIEQFKKESPIDTIAKKLLPIKKSSFEVQTDSNEKIANIVTQLSKTKLKSDIENNEIRIQIDNDKLTKILKKNKIDDPTIVKNVKTALDDYIEYKGDKLSQQEAEEIVFHAIHFSIYGTDEISHDFKKNPEKLFKNLENSKIFQTPLRFDKHTQDTNIINPKDIISEHIPNTTGVWRQKQEFGILMHENIKQLFKSLESTSEYPIKIKNITYEVLDDDVNRIIKYKVTLQNEGGGKKEPYDIYINIPYIVNDRYLKLNGVSYIVPIQQFMKPITKTTTDEIRVLSNYAIISLSLRNVKFTPTEVNEIINHIQLNYPDLITEYKEDEYIKFKDNSVIYLNQENVYSSQLGNTIFDKSKAAIIDHDGNETKMGKNEFIYSLLIDKIALVNPTDRLTKTSKSIPHFSIYLGGFRLPFIIYLWQQKGLLSTLNDFGVDYKIVEIPPKDTKYFIKCKEGYLAIYPKTKREVFLCNGLLQFKVDKVIEDLDNPTEIHELIDQTLGQKATYNMREMYENMIDPITKKLLDTDGLPTNINNLLSTTCVDKLLNGKVESMSDLKIYRARQAEMFLKMMYSQIKMSHSEYRRKINIGDQDAKLVFYDNYVIENIYNHAGVLSYTEPTNPIDEIYLASKTIKIGPGGIPGKQSVQKPHRNVHESHIGIIGPNSNSESENVGLDAAHTLTSAIMNEHGSYGRKSVNALSGWNALAANEILTPFMNEIDSDRMVMAATHYYYSAF